MPAVFNNNQSEWRTDCEAVYPKALRMIDDCPTDDLANLQRTLSVHRYEHTLGVAKESIRLAIRFGCAPEKACRAGLLHDCAKSMDRIDMLKLIDGSEWDVGELERSIDSLLHAPAGAVLARLFYRETDEEVLSAIRWHTIGKPGMSKLEKIVYLADLIEPNRKPFDGIDAIRQLSVNDLDHAVLAAAESSVRYVNMQGGTVHPNTLDLVKSLN